MREIKFRAWCVNYFDAQKSKIIYSEMRYQKDTGLWALRSFVGNTWGLDEVEFMQFTGVLDKNGKEIYEGDIITIKGYRAHEVFMPAIYNTIYHQRQHGYSTEIEIIGNIYDNPELKEG
jgi:uncharacterized phage protein (TIGR01671 family)